MKYLPTGCTSMTSPSVSAVLVKLDPHKGEGLLGSCWWVVRFVAVVLLELPLRRAESESRT
jgi:hypothetical protein